MRTKMEDILLASSSVRAGSPAAARVVGDGLSGEVTPKEKNLKGKKRYTSIPCSLMPDFSEDESNSEGYWRRAVYSDEGVRRRTGRHPSV